MDTKTVEIRLLGTFSVSHNGKTISDRHSRSGSLWLLLGYLLHNHAREVSDEELYALLWEGDDSTNPANALKTMLHRLRTMLDTLEEGFGKAFIIRSGHRCRVSPEFTLSLDTEDFETLCSYAGEMTDDNARLSCLMRAIELYKGHFAPRLSGEFAESLARRYRELFAKSAREAAHILEAQGRNAELESLCRRTMVLMPNEEFACLRLCRSLLSRGKKQAVMDIYSTYANSIYAERGALPCDELRALYREASKTRNEITFDITSLAAKLCEAESSPGAYICDYDFFEAVYRTKARAMHRSGLQSHIALISATDSKGEPLARRSLDICMDNLDDIIRLSLRKGDIAAKCSVSQYVVLLPETDYNNICVIIERIIKHFDRQYPHSPARLRYSVCPVEPNK